MAQISGIAVYCGSRTGDPASYRHLATALGTRIAAERLTLVYGGGRVGLMGVLADAALAAGGRVVGVIPDFLLRPEIAHDRLDEQIVVDSLHARKQRMFDLADAFVVLPGGLGTLDEAVEVVTWRLLGLHDKPIVFLDGTYWAPLLGLIDHFVAHDFLAAEARGLYTVADDLDALFGMLHGRDASGAASSSELL